MDNPVIVAGPNGVATASKTAGGSGYVANEIITLTGSQYGTGAKIKVLTVTAGAIATFEINAPGINYLVGDALTQASTTGSGTGATFTVATLAEVLAYSLAEIKEDLRINFSDTDSVISRMCAVAVERIEKYIGRQLINAYFELSMDRFPGGRSELSDFWYSARPYGDQVKPVFKMPVLPLESISAINYYDAAGNLQTLAADQYQVDTVKGRIAPAPSVQTWPETSCELFNAVKITFKAGYGSSYTAVPVKIRQAVSMLVAFYYENRETFSAVSFNDLPEGVDELLAEFKAMGF